MFARAIVLLSFVEVAFGQSCAQKPVEEIANDADGVAMLQNPFMSLDSYGNDEEKNMAHPKHKGKGIADKGNDKAHPKHKGKANASKDKSKAHPKHNGKATAEPTINFKAAFAEYIAMTLFVIIGCGSAMAVAKTSGWVLQVSLSFGFAITALAYAIGHYSGGHINCAVTFGLVLAGKYSVLQGLLNFAAQMLGSMTGAGVLRAMFPEGTDKTGGLGSNGVSEGWTQINALIGEFAMTFLLMFVVLETAVNPAAKANSALACLAIGFAVFLAHCVLIPIDGCSINPTRSFGPALVAKLSIKDANTFGDMWVFWVGPLLGAAAATIVSTVLMA